MNIQPNNASDEVAKLRMKYDAEEWAKNAMARWWTRLGLAVAAVLCALVMYGCPPYRVWQQGMEGEAELRRAEQNRQIAVQEAQAKKESAAMLAEAEVARARGVAEANKIIGDSLKGNEAYLRWLWIDALNNPSSGDRVVYIPTEAGLPILEAGKR